MVAESLSPANSLSLGISEIAHQLMVTINDGQIVELLKKSVWKHILVSVEIDKAAGRY